MKFKITGLLLCLAGAAIASFFPLPGNLIGIPIIAIGAIMAILSGGRKNWRNLR
ncbi:MAG TPA: hypothetical protein VI791_00650 [Patescibacteria group bacterium]|nr:hypothetical protein [Patescibacteria group bacterium]